MNSKSLRNTMLDYAVINFNEVFEKLRDPSTNTEIVFPPFLFEKILLKSKELGWEISSRDLEICFLHRDILRWENIRLTLFWYTREVFESMVKTKYPVKSLDLDIEEFDDKVIEHIKALGPSLESLEIMYSTRLTKRFSNENFPNLKRLSFQRRLRYFHYGMEPFIVDLRHNVLVQFRLENELIDISTIRSFKCLTNLKSLSFSHCQFLPVNNNSCIEELGTLTNLRTLTLCPITIPDDSSLFEKLKQFCNLERLNISYSEWNDNHLLSFINSRQKKLKQLAIFGYSNEGANVKTLADQVVARLEPLTVETFVINAEFNLENRFCRIPFSVNDPLQIVHLVTVDNISTIEKILIESLRTDVEDTYLSTVLQYFIELCPCTPEFIMKIIFIECSRKYNLHNKQFHGERPSLLPKLLKSKQVRAVVRAFIQKNLNKKLTENVRRMTGSK